MLASALIALSAAIVFLLGTAHLIITFVGSRLAPRDAALRDAMQATHPVITRQTTMWRAWIGFNASHSFGGMLFGLVYGYLALVQRDLLLASAFLLGVGFAMLAGLLVLARLYWFRLPFTGIAFALLAYVGALVLALR